MIIYLQVDKTNGKILGYDDVYTGFNHKIDVSFEPMNIFNYKYIDGDLIELTEEEKEEFYPKTPEENPEETILQTIMLENARVSTLENLSDKDALQVVTCYDTWESYINKAMEEGIRTNYQGKLVKARQDINVVLENQPPGIDTSALYEIIEETHQGTLEDPILYSPLMTVYSGKYYLENDINYQCIRDPGQPLYATCASLVGNYFEVAQ